MELKTKPKKELEDLDRKVENLLNRWERQIKIGEAIKKSKKIYRNQNK